MWWQKTSCPPPNLLNFLASVFITSGCDQISLSRVAAAKFRGSGGLVCVFLSFSVHVHFFVHGRYDSSCVITNGYLTIFIGRVFVMPPRLLPCVVGVGMLCIINSNIFEQCCIFRKCVLIFQDKMTLLLLVNCDGCFVWSVKVCFTPSLPN